jgi:hypothetical protein
MSITFELLEEFTGSRTNEMPDPENEGQTLTVTDTNVRDVQVRFTCEDSGCVHERSVNVVFVDGIYDTDLTLERIQEVANGVAHKISCGVIAPATE